MKKEQLKSLIKEEVKKILSEDENQINDSYKKILELIRIESKKLNDNDSYELHEKLKSWFNKLIEMKDFKGNKLQQYYDSIKLGKGDKTIFLKMAKTLYPHIVDPQIAFFDRTIEKLKANKKLS